MSVPSGRAEEETGPAVVLAAVDRPAAAGEVGFGAGPEAPEAHDSNGEVPSDLQKSKVLGNFGATTNGGPGPGESHRDQFS